jgi:hypothetical protein
MIHKGSLRRLNITFMVSSLQGGLHHFCGTWLRCNSLEWSSHSASLRLALHLKNCTLHPVQLPDLGLCNESRVFPKTHFIADGTQNDGLQIILELFFILPGKRGG